MSILFALQAFFGANVNTNPKKLGEGIGVNASNLDVRNNDFRGLLSAAIKHTLTGLGVQQISFTRFNRAAPAADNGTDIYLTAAGDVNYARSLLALDTSQRTYYTDGVKPKYTDTTTIGGSPPYPAGYVELGVPAPNAAMAAALGTAGSGVNVTRLYLDTFLRPNLDESAPNPNPTSIVVAGGSSVNLSSLAAVPGGSHGITLRRIYVSESGGAYRRLTTQAATLTTYTDPGTTASRGLTLTTGGDDSIPAWLPPPDVLVGLMELWNGMLAGWYGKAYRVCVPYQGHAWPIEYEHIVPDDIVGAAKWGQQVLLATTGAPRLLTGDSPGSLNDSPIPWQQACVAKRSVVGVGHGVCWASNDGLAYYGQIGPPRLLTEALLSKEQWRALVPSTIIGAWWKRYYIGFYNDGTRKGFMIDTTNPSGIIWLTQGAYGVFQDTVTEALYLLDTSFAIRRWDSGTAQSATFKTGIITHPQGKTNPAAARVIATTYPVTFTLWALLDQPGAPDAPVWTQVFTKSVTNNLPFRLPGGYAAEQFQVQVDGTGPMEAVFVAEQLVDLP